MIKNTIIIGNGYIGKDLTNFLQKNSINVDNIFKSKINYFDINLINNYINLAKQNGLDYIINCAGYTGRPNVEGCESDKEMCWKYNVNLPILLTEIARIHEVPIIHISSGCIYTGDEKEFTEEDIPNFGIFNQNSSFYSKTKHACEISLNGSDSYIFRIRMPFSYKSNNRNYINKIIAYDNLISYKNSLTNIEDFNSFILKFISLKNKPDYGVYNVTNKGFATAEQVTEILKKYNIENKNWKFLSQKDMNFKAERSNCVLSTNKIKNIGLELPEVLSSLDESIKSFKNGV
jgi:nucleoside-diphosphate-sugar epimerase